MPSTSRLAVTGLGLRAGRRALSAVVITLALLGLAQACTVGIFSGRAMTDGRPLIWKNRDVAHVDQAVRYFTDGTYPYLGLINDAEPQNVWGGLNSAGFGIMNSNSGNLGAGSTEGVHDGAVMKLALQTCASVNDFQRLLDSLLPTTFAVPCNFGVLDSSGATAFFETGPDFYVRVNGDSPPEGYVLRANFSMCRDTAGQGSMSRYLRAVEVVKQAAKEGRLDLNWVVNHVAADLGTPGFDPYPLPFRGEVSGLPTGFVPAIGTINRNSTRCAIFIQGRKPGDAHGLATMWAALGQPILAVAVPLWTGARSVPDAVRDAPLSRLCSEAKAVKARVYTYARNTDAVNTVALSQLNCQLNPARSAIIRATADELARWAGAEPGTAELADFQQRMADRALSSYTTPVETVVRYMPALERTPTFSVRRSPQPGTIVVLVPGDPENRALTFVDGLGRVRARVDLSGPEYRARGQNSVDWSPEPTAAGIYFAVLEVGNRRQTISFPLYR